VIITYVCASSQAAPDCKVIIFPKDELDKANKDKKHFPPNFQVCRHSCHGYWVDGASQREELPLTGTTRLFTPSPRTKQVHVVLSEVASNEVNVDDDVSSGDEDYEDEEDLSDTDNEEEWDTPEPV